MKFPSFIVATLGLQLAWLPISTLAAQADYDGGWAGTYSCSAAITDPSRPEFSNETKLTIANGSANGEFSRSTKLGKETENWTGSITNGNLNLSNAARREDGATWTLRFNGAISGSDKISISGEMLGRTGQKVRDCKLVISLTAPSQASLVGKAKTAEENQARQKLATDSEKKRIVADKEALAAQTRKLEADRTAALKEQVQIAEANKLQIEQQAKIVAEKEAELAAESQKIEDEKAAASEAQEQIAEKERLLAEQQAKLIAEKEQAARESYNNTQLLLFALGGLLVTGFVIFLAIRRKGTAVNNHKEQTTAKIEVQNDTNESKEIKAEKERQELALREQVATLEKEKDALIAREQIAVSEAKKEAALYQIQIEKLEQERLTAMNLDKKDSEKTSETLRIASTDARISIPLTAAHLPSEQELADKTDVNGKKVEISQSDSLNESKEKLFNFIKKVKDLTIKASEDLKSDETKAKLKDFANQAQSLASEKTKNLKHEFNKINEARRDAANEAKDLESASKFENSKAVALSFWSKLTAKQRGILIGLPLIIVVSFSILYEEPDNIWTLDEYKAIAAGGMFRNREILMNPNLPSEIKVKFSMCVNRGIKSKFSAKSLVESDKSYKDKYISNTDLKCSANPNLYMDVSPPIGLDPNIWFSLNL